MWQVEGWGLGGQWTQQAKPLRKQQVLQKCMPGQWDWEARNLNSGPCTHRMVWSSISLGGRGHRGRNGSQGSHCTRVIGATELVAPAAD